MGQRSPSRTLFPYTTLFRSSVLVPGSVDTRIGASTRNRPAELADGLGADDAAFLDQVLTEKTATGNSPDEVPARSEEHTSELQSRRDLVCRLLLEKKKKKRH